MLGGRGGGGKSDAAKGGLWERKSASDCSELTNSWLVGCVEVTLFGPISGQPTIAMRRAMLLPHSQCERYTSRENIPRPSPQTPSSCQQLRLDWQEWRMHQ